MTVDRLFKNAVTLLPKTLLSRLLGYVVDMPLPYALQVGLNKLFVRAFGIDLAEAELVEAAAYPTLNKLFTRRLRPGARPAESAVVSPADGILSQSMPAIGGELLQAKGILYDPLQLIWGSRSKAPAEEQSRRWKGWSATVYLAPKNYHRVHAPMTLDLCRIRYIPGSLWPVNGYLVRSLPGLFAVNERLVFDFEDPQSGGRLFVVMVGALNVGKMTTPFWPGFATNCWGAHRRGDVLEEPPAGGKVSVKAGDELGVFCLGSTVVMVYDEVLAARFTLRLQDQPRPILCGQSLLAEGNS